MQSKITPARKNEVCSTSIVGMSNLDLRDGDLGIIEACLVFSSIVDILAGRNELTDARM